MVCHPLSGVYGVFVFLQLGATLEQWLPFESFASDAHLARGFLGPLVDQRQAEARERHDRQPRRGADFPNARWELNISTFEETSRWCARNQGKPGPVGGSPVCKQTHNYGIQGAPVRNMPKVEKLSAVARDHIVSPNAPALMTIPANPSKGVV